MANNKEIVLLIDMKHAVINRNSPSDCNTLYFLSLLFFKQHHILFLSPKAVYMSCQELMRSSRDEAIAHETNKHHHSAAPREASPANNNPAYLPTNICKWISAGYVPHCYENTQAAAQISPVLEVNLFQRLACLHVRELGKRRGKKVAWRVIATLFRGVGLPH